MTHQILVLEDEALIAWDLKDTIEAEEIGKVVTFSDSQSALDWLDRKTPSAAMLDLNLGGGQTSESVAAVLMDRKVPFFFLTGYTASNVNLPQKFDEVERLSKPFEDAELLAALRRRLGDPKGTRDGA